jgi:integrase
LLPPKAGTYRWLCTEYFASSEFARLNPSTQRVRRGVLESTFEEPIAPGDRLLFADFPLARMTAKAVRVLRDRKADRPDAANNRLKFVRQVFAWGVEHDHVETNPALGIATIRVATEGYHSWTPTEVTQFEQRHPLGTTAHLALKLALLTGLRRSDLVRVGRQHERNGWLKLTLQKNRGRRPVVVELPILPALQAVLDASPVGDLTFLATSFGRPFTAAGFGNWFRDRCNEAGLPHCSAHGLRKAGATLAAEQGATTHELMAIFGWLTMRQAETYTRTAQRKRMAGEAMNLLVRREAK